MRNSYISNSNNIAYKQFGNSVVVNVLKSVLENVLEINNLFAELILL
ncbi:hypothetical protein [Geminocystis sp. GBBB08]|nr:hypothetical protein [Geminocystis sp. GBBB08]